MNKVKIIFAGVLLVAACVLGGCRLAIFDTATQNFDNIFGNKINESMGDFLDSIVAGAEPGEENGVSISVLTPTPTTDPAFLPTPTPQVIATPTPANGEPALTKVDEWVYVNVDYTVVRAGWSTDYLSLGNINHNEAVHRVAILQNGWSKISYNGTYGYCDTQDLVKSKPGTTTVTHMDIFEYTATAAAAGEDVHIIQMMCLFQKPELPSGSEIAALATVLRYYGQTRISKVTLDSRYLPKAEPGTASPYAAYIGNPAANSSYGCYAPVIVNVANTYMNSKSMKRVATDISGSTPEEILELVRNDVPVMVWVTKDMVPSKKGPTWNIDGKEITWMDGEQCMVLIGYNKTKNTVIVCDTLKGIVEYDSEAFFARYNEQYRNACIIGTK